MYLSVLTSAVFFLVRLSGFYINVGLSPPQHNWSRVYYLNLLFAFNKPKYLNFSLNQEVLDSCVILKEENIIKVKAKYL